MEADDILWVLPLGGAILCLTAILAPAAVISVNSFFYSMNGFVFLYGYGFITGNAVGLGSFQQTFTAQEPDQLIGITVELIILLITIILMIMGALLNKTGRLKVGNANKIWLFSGIMIIALAIGWIIGAELMVAQEISELTKGFITISFWEIATPSWGLVGLFFGGALSLIAGLTSIINENR